MVACPGKWVLRGAGEVRFGALSGGDVRRVAE